MNETELLDFIINPSFLELIKQPVSSVTFNPWVSFDFIRHGRKLHCTIYSGENGQVNISERDQIAGNVIIRDFCQTPEQFAQLFIKLDDLLTRMPIKK